MHFSPLFFGKVQNHDHACTTSCGRHKAQPEANGRTDQPKKKKKNACRFGFDHVIDMVVDGRPRRIRRQGKKLSDKPFVNSSLDPKEYGKISLRRTHPFRSSSSDVAQVTGRSNIDLQCTTRLPVLSGQIGSMDEQASSNATSSLNSIFSRKGKNAGSGAKHALLVAVSAAFRAAHCADYYITKYASKSLQIFSPLMRQLADSIAALQRDEEQEKERDSCKPDEKANSDEHDQCTSSAKTPTAAQPLRRARRVLFRMCFAVNRSFWLSCTEFYVILATNASGWQTHNEKVLFMARLMFMARHAKSQLDKQTHAVEELDEPDASRDMDQMEHTFDNDDADPAPQLMQTTSVVDDYIHRGEQWKDMSLYVYCMHVRRVERSRFQTQSTQVVFFDPHYKLFRTYVQRLNFYCSVPRLVGPQIPTMHQDLETKASIKAVLFCPYRCQGICTDCSIFNPLLAQEKNKSWSFNLAWRTFQSTTEVLAEHAAQCDIAAQKMHSLADCIELRGWLPDCPVQRSLDAISLRSIVRSLVDNFLPARCMQHIASYLCVKHTGAACSDSNECMSLHPGYHNHQPCMREHCSRLTRRLAANLDLAAEARLKPPKPQNAADIPHSESESDIEATAETEEQLFFGPDYEDELGPIEDENLPLSAAYAFLMPQGQDAADFALRKDIVLDATRAKRPTVSQKMLSKYYAVFSLCFSKQPPLDKNAFRAYGIHFKDNFTETMAAQTAWIDAAKKQEKTAQFDTYQGAHEKYHQEHDQKERNTELIDLDDNECPANIAWYLMTKHTASEDQINFMSLLVAPMQKA